MSNKSPVPSHVAIVMDGNGRWAQKRFHPRTFGHLIGVKTAKAIMLAARDAGVRFLTLYTFSAENWSRPAAEVNFLMHLIQRHFRKDKDFLLREGVRIRVMGSRSGLSSTLTAMINDIEHVTAKNTAIEVNLAFNYSGRQDILQAVVSLLRSHTPPESLSEDAFSEHLYLKNIPDPELIIRTGGEKRLSNFLLWQSAYSELYFCDTLWPDFTAGAFKAALSWYATRTRKFGNIGDSSQVRL